MHRLTLPLAVASQLAILFAAHAQNNGPAANEPVSPSSGHSQALTTRTLPSGTGTAQQGAQSQTPTSAAQTTLQDPGVGEHVSSVAPEHPLSERRHFGECVVEIAMGGDCPHDPEQ